MSGAILLLLSYISLTPSSKTNQDVGGHFTVIELHQSSSDTNDQSGCWGPFYCYWVTPMINQDVGDHFTVIELHQWSVRMLGTILLLLSYIRLARTPKTSQDVGGHFTVIEFHQRPIRMLGTILLLLSYISLAPTPKTSQDIVDMDWQTKHFITSGLHQSRKIWSVEELETVSAGPKPKTTPSMAWRRSQQHQCWNWYGVHKPKRYVSWHIILNWAELCLCERTPVCVCVCLLFVYHLRMTTSYN